MVCSNQGHGSQKYLNRTDIVREARGLTHNGYGAAFQVNYNHYEGKYMITKFNNEHSHKLVAIYGTQFLHSYRHVSDVDFAHPHALHQVGVKVCQFMDYKSDQVEGFHNVGFMGKDLQNKLDKNLCVGCMDTDSEAVIVYLAAKADSDVGVYYEYTLDDANRLRNLLWTDMVAKYDYECFGDVLAFDATYKKNAYNKPSVVFVRINHHRRTTIFGFALLTNEIVDSYTWLLLTFLNAMNNKKPKSIITDGDNTMSKAIKTIMTGCSNRLCCWHLERNAQSNIKKEEFMTKFRHLMYSPLSIDVFERQWSTLVSKMGLEQNVWVQKMYQKREKWAEASLKGIFFGAMRSTQRSENLNSYFCRFVQLKLKLYDFNLQVYRALYCIRHTEAKDEFQSNHTTPVLILHLHSIEKHASEVYTKSVFQWVRAVIDSEASLIMIKCDKRNVGSIYTISKFEHPQLKWTVVFHADGVHFMCCCKMLESGGIPCSHIFHVMKLEQIIRIPDSLIIERWTKSVKQFKNMNVNHIPPQLDQDFSEIAKFGSLAAACSNLSLFASKNDSAYMEALEEIQRMTNKFQHMVASDDQNAKGLYRSNEGDIKLKDPLVVKTKRCAKEKNDVVRTRRCSQRQHIGHTKRNCPFNPLADDPFISMGESSMGVEYNHGGPIDGNVSTATYWMPSNFNGRFTDNESVGGHDSNNQTTFQSWWPHFNL